MEQNQLPICAYQNFFGSTLAENDCYEKILLAYLYSENFGPVICIVTELGYDYLVRNHLDEIYIDIIICETPEAVTQFVEHILSIEDGIDKGGVFINSLQECDENLRILYNQTGDNLLPIKELISNAVENEKRLNALI